MSTDPRILSTGVWLNKKESTITFEFEPEDFQTLVDRGLKATMWVSVGQSNDLAELSAEVERLKAELKEAEDSACEAWQRVSDAERELGIVLPDERGAGDTWPRIGRALRGEQREGDLSYRAPQRR